MSKPSSQNIDRKWVLQALKYLGFWKVGKTAGNASGHDVFTNGVVSCQAVVRKRDVSISAIAGLGLELEKKGVIAKRDFLRLVKRRP